MIPLLLAFWFAPQERPVEKATLAGVVVDSVTGQPLSRATVLAESSAGAASTTSDAQGRFELVDLDPGQYHVKGRRNGYLESYQGARRPETKGPALPLEPGQNMKDLRLKLIPMAVVAGTVRDSDGEPLVGARVFLVAVTYSEGHRTYSQQDDRMTDDLGQYRIATPPGRYYVRADPEDRQERSRAIDHSPKNSKRPEVRLSTFYPAAQNISAARLLDVDAGARINGIDISIGRSAVFRVSVHADAPPGLEPSLGLASLRGEMGSEGYHPIKVGRGDFEFRNVTPGSYILSAQARPPAGPFLGVFNFSQEDGDQTRMPVEVGNADVEGLRVTISPGAEISGRLIADDGSPPKFAGARVRLMGDTGTYLYVKDGNSFRTTLSPGTYQVYVEHETKVKSIRWDDKDVLNEGLTVTGSGAISLEIVMTADGGSIDGVVVDEAGKPAPGATVVLVPELKRRNRWDLFLSATADQYGRYELKKVSPGEYKLYTWDDLEPGIWFDPDFLKNVEKQGEPVTIAAKGHETVKLHLVPAR